MRRTRFVAFSSAALLLVAAGLLPQKAQTVPLILPEGGGSPNSASRSPMLAPNGRTAAMASEASNLVSNDTDAVRDILVVKLKKGTATCVSVSTEGVKADDDSDDPVLDRAGRRVAFASLAANLVEGDSNGVQDIFVHDARKASTVRVSVSTDGAEADGPSQQPWISSNGRYVAFASEATNLVPGDTNGLSDVFVHDLRTGETQLASLAADGAAGNGASVLPRLSANGRYLGFLSAAGNLVAGDGNARRDVFVRDLKKGTLEMVSLGAANNVGNGHCDTLSLSANGRRVAFDSRASNLHPADQHAGLDVFLRDRKKQTTTLVSKPAGASPADGDSSQPSLAGNGRWLAFTSAATNLVAGDGNGASDVFRTRLKTGVIERVSVSTSGVEADGNSDTPSLSRNGRFVVFTSRATNLFDGTTTDGTWSVALRRP